MADTQPAKSTNAPAAKARSPVERVIVWGLIGVLAVAAGFEFLSKRGHASALQKLQDKIDAVDKDAKHPEVTENDVKEAVGGRQPSSSKDYPPGERAANGAKRVEVYSWFTLNPSSKREMWVYYAARSKDSKELATVLQITESDIATMPEPAVATADPAKEGAAPVGGMGGMSGPPGGMGGGPGMSGPPGGMGGRGGQRGRPAAEKPADAAENADADKPDAKPADEEKPATDKPADDKPAEEKAADKSE